MDPIILGHRKGSLAVGNLTLPAQGLLFLLLVVFVAVYVFSDFPELTLYSLYSLLCVATEVFAWLA